MTAAWFLGALIAHALAQGEVPPARVCYGPLGAPLNDCSNVRDSDVAPFAGHAGEAFVLVRPAAREIRFGVCGEADQASVQPVDVTIEDSDRAPAILVTVAAENRWSFTAAARELQEIRTIRGSSGRYQLTLHAPHYRDATAEFDAAMPKRIHLVLRRLPVITGRVLSWSGQPLPNASVKPLPGDTGCTTDFDGSFRCEINGPWPRSISVAVPRTGTRVIALGSSERDTNLGEIRMSRGARLMIHIDAPSELESVALSLFRDDAGKSPVQIAERTVILPASDGTSISELDPGIYRLLIRGERPYQQHAAKVAIREGDNEERISIRESELTLRVYSATRPEAGASILLKNLEGRWSGTVQTDESGKAVEPLWQLGEFTASVRAKNSASPVLDHHEFSAGARQQWTFQLPIGRVEGRVLNETGAAIADAEVSLTTDDGDVKTALRSKTDANGQYAFEGVRAGAQSVSAAAQGYMPSDAIDFRLLENEPGRNVDITLRRGLTKSVEVVDPRGVPLPNATLLESLNNTLVNSYSTGGDGRAEVQLPAGGSPVLFVIPASGGFAVHRVTSADRELASIRIVVPDPVASLELETETTEHQPVRDVHFLVRYDGETIPFDVLMHLAQRFGVDFKTGANGSGTITNLPAGLYELWPYAKMTAVDALMSGLDVPAPLRVAVVQGANSATLTFRTKRR